MKTKIPCLSLCVFALALSTVAVVADGAASTYSGPEKTYTGIVTAVDLSQHTLKTRGELLFGKTFSLGGACSYSFVDGPGNTSAGLHPGQKITVIYQGVDGVLVADRIVEQPMRFTGWVKAVNTNAHTITVQSGGFRVSRQFQFSDGCRVLLLGDKLGSLADIQPGNHVTLTYEEPPGLAAMKSISQTSEKFTGSLTAIDLEAKTLKAKDVFDTRSFNVGEHCVIDLDGKGGGRLGDLRPEQKLVLTFDDIDGVNVVNHIAPAKESGDSISAAAPPGGS